MTYDDVFNGWYADISPTLQAGPSRRRPKAIHELHVSPRIGRRPITEIRRSEIFSLLSELFRTKPVTAGHALGHIRQVFERANTLEIREDSPAPPRSVFPKRVSKPKHHGTVAPERLPDLWRWLQERQAGQSTLLAILTAMCTGHRVGVVVAARWSHIDEMTGVWTVPERQNKTSAGHMKSGREFSLKLPEPLLKELKSLKDSQSEDFIFPSNSESGHITSNAILKLLKSFDPSLTTHGFRNAIKVWCMSTDPQVPEHIADAFCDHSLKGLDAAYRRMDTFSARAEVARRLHDYIVSHPA
jgi:integrase